MSDVFERVEGKLVYAEGILDLFYVASAGQDKAFVEIVEDVVDNTPEVDAVEVVRCKDCKHWGGVTFGYVCRRFSGIYIRNETRETDFCSYGELKELGK